MPKIAEKPNFTNAIGGQICEKVMSVGVQTWEKPIYGNLEKYAVK
jgi:hypothetical protein